MLFSNNLVSLSEDVLLAYWFKYVLYGPSMTSKSKMSSIGKGDFD